MCDGGSLARLVAIGARHDVREAELVLTDFGVWLLDFLCAVGVMEHPLVRLDRRARRSIGEPLRRRRWYFPTEYPEQEAA